MFAIIKKIPETPKIRFRDYLNDFIIQRTKGNDEVRIYKIRNFLRSKIKEKSIKAVADLLGIDYHNLRNWIGKSKKDFGIPLTQLFKIARHLKIHRKTIHNKIEVFGGTNTKKYQLPKYLNPKLAYLMGFIMGDGHLSNPSDTISNGSLYNADIRITTSEKQHLIFLQDIFFSLFKYKPPLFKEKEFYRLVGRSKVVHLFLSKVCEIPTGNKKDKTLVPKILNNNQSLKRYFLSGFFDADGCAIISKNKISNIRIKQHNRKILEQCYDILKKEGIESMGIYSANGLRNNKITIGHVLAIQNQKDIKIFTNKFFSLKIQDKNEALIMENIEKPQHIAIIPDGNESS